MFYPLDRGVINFTINFAAALETGFGTGARSGDRNIEKLKRVAHRRVYDSKGGL